MELRSEMKYKKKPIPIEAFRWGFEQPPEWFDKAIDEGKILFPVKGNWDIEIVTLEGRMGANAGTYIVQGVNGELYPCVAEVFEKTYERVEDEHISGLG